MRKTFERLKPGDRFVTLADMEGTLHSDISDQELHWQTLKGAPGHVISVNEKTGIFRVEFSKSTLALGVWTPRVPLSHTKLFLLDFIETKNEDEEAKANG